MMTGEFRIVAVFAIIAILSVSYVVTSVLRDVIRIVRRGVPINSHQRSWRTRLVKYVLLATPIVS